MVALRRSKAITAAALAAALAPLPGFSGTFTPPPGCRLEVTVQQRGCSVLQQYRCDSDAAGDQRAAVFRREGLVYLSQIDAETRWLHSTQLPEGIEDVLVEDSADHASFSTLLHEGMDEFDFMTRSNLNETLRFIGHDRLTGRKRVIDGVELEETRFLVTSYDEAGRSLIQRSGQQFINRAMGRFYGGIEESFDWTGETRNTNDTPVLFSFPGEEGFGDTEPKFDCDEMIAQARLQERPQL